MSSSGRILDERAVALFDTHDLQILIAQGAQWHWSNTWYIPFAWDGLLGYKAPGRVVSVQSLDLAYSVQDSNPSSVAEWIWDKVGSSELMGHLFPEDFVFIDARAVGDERRILILSSDQFKLIN